MTPRQVIPLGAKQAPPSPSIDLAPVVSALRDQIAAQVMESIGTEIVAEIRDAMSAVVARVGNPRINVTAPAVTVGSPGVTVEPTINVPTPEVFVDVKPEIRVPGMEALSAAQTETNALLRELIALLKQPVIKDVERTGQYIDRVVERRGN